MGMQRVIVTMPEDLVAAVDAYAVADGRSRAAVIRRALQTVFQPVLHIPETVMVSDQSQPVMDSESRLVARMEKPTHVFKAQTGNALRCECGHRRSDHRSP